MSFFFLFFSNCSYAVCLSETDYLRTIDLYPDYLLDLFYSRFAHVFHEPAKVPIMNVHFNLPLQIITIICFVPLIFMIFTVMVLVSLMSQGLHLERGCLRILLPFMRAYISFGDFRSGVKFSGFGEYALVDQEQPNRFGMLILPNQSSCSFPFPLSGLLVILSFFGRFH